MAIETEVLANTSDFELPPLTSGETWTKHFPNVEIDELGDSFLRRSNERSS